MQLAQVTEEVFEVPGGNAIPPVDMETYNGGFSILNTSTTIIALLCFLALTVAWIAALYGAFTRKDLKHERWMWFFLIIFFPITMYFYFFIENRKKWGIISVVATVLIIIAPLIFVMLASAAL